MPGTEFQQTVVFADGAGGGNPCPVVFGAEAWSSEQMQAIAASFGEETGFVLAPVAGGDIRLRYFVPRHEMEMCVHATVAAVVVAGRAGGLPAPTAVVETPLGPRQVAWDASAGSATVEMFTAHFGTPVSETDELLRALGTSPEQLANDLGPVQSVSVARPKLMVPLREGEAVDALEPDFEHLWELCERLGVTGIYPFSTNADEADANARQFPLRAGYDEDAATGVAAGALGAYLTRHTSRSNGWRRWTIAQGRAMGRPSRIQTEVLVSDGALTDVRVGGLMQTIGERQPLKA